LLFEHDLFRKTGFRFSGSCRNGSNAATAAAQAEAAAISLLRRWTARSFHQEQAPAQELKSPHSRGITLHCGI
jgi:hypothetical protein